MKFLWIPENNPFIKECLAEDMEAANDQLQKAEPFIAKAAEIKEEMLKKLIEHFYSLIPADEIHKEHRDFLHRVHKSTSSFNEVGEKKLLEIFIFAATHPTEGKSYQGFYDERPLGFHTHIRTAGDTGKRARTIAANRILKEINVLFQGHGEFMWFSDANETAVEISFRLLDGN